MHQFLFIPRSLQRIHYLSISYPMKRAARFILLMCIPLLCCFQCGEEPPLPPDCEPASLQTITSQDITPVLIGSQPGDPSGARVFQANSLTEVLAAVPAPELNSLSIDFSRYTLLGGIFRNHTGARVRSQAVTLDCNGVYTYYATVETVSGQSPTNLFFGLLVPKLPTGTKALFNLQAIP
jgi:hypothetical protein